MLKSPLITIAMALTTSVAHAQTPDSTSVATDMTAFCRTINLHTMRFYPDRAREEGQQGAAMLDCLIADDKLSTCRVTEEAPPNWGFGDAAMKIACNFVVVREGDQPRVRGASAQTRVFQAPDGSIHAFIPVRFALQG